MAALYRISTFLSLGYFICQTTASVIRRDASNSQIHFVGCGNNQMRAIVYNEWSPGPSQPPDDWMLLDDKHSSFLSGGILEGNSHLRNVPWKVQTQQHGRESDMFKSFIGNATYGSEGFNCFQDDNHFAFINFLVGNCYSEIYCTHQEARNLSITASTDVVDLATNITAEDILSEATKRIEKQSMSKDPVTLDATIPFNDDAKCSIFFDGKGTNEDLKALIKILVEIVAKEPALFRYQVDKHNGACVCLNPNACVCDDPTFTGRLTLPKKYTLTTTNNPPPFSNNNPSLGPFLEATITCAPPVEDNSLCMATQLALGAGALVPGVGAAFGALLWSATMACSI